MKFLADENFPALCVQKLREAGLDVKWVRTDFQGIDDVTVLSKATEEARTILTFDKDFGDMVFRDKLPFPFGIILVRLNIFEIHSTSDFLTQVICSRQDWYLHFSVIETDKIRIR